jgi:hypothetical protein
MLSESTNASDLAISVDQERPSTGWRKAFAHWITKPDSRAASLLARVTVNRWWAHHFGTGIVATPENLGYSGALPSHPELLEYLAGTFIQNGWSAKALHREILLSAAYRQSSSPTDAGALRDPQASLLSRYPVHRLDAEAIRDGMLAVAGDLDAASGGPYVPTERAEDGDVIVKPDTPGALRRSIYLQQRRTQVLGMLDVFDAPSLVTNCTLRVQTTIPLQSLKLLNSEFVRERASSLAAHSQQTSDPAARIGELYVRVIGRAPSDAEQAAALRFIADQPSAYPDADNAGELAWIDFCQALMSSNAFLYVE